MMYVALETVYIKCLHLAWRTDIFIHTLTSIIKGIEKSDKPGPHTLNVILCNET